MDTVGVKEQYMRLGRKYCGVEEGGIDAEGVGVDLIKTHYIIHEIIKQKGLMSLIFREKKITTSVRYLLTPTRIPFIRTKRVWWCISTIPVFGRLRVKNDRIKASLYDIVRTHFERISRHRGKVKYE